ncbi:hypothetical protein Dongsha4_09185 [Cyanobacterium sp. Dongsha4]|nr:hypothetical protein Dongsha4_09185 [Cyanobacterium sp. Dongsha4]
MEEILENYGLVKMMDEVNFLPFSIVIIL